MSNPTEKVVDAQTNTSFILIPERWYDIVAAWFSIGYSLATIGYLGWLLLDTWTGVYSARFLKSYTGAINGLDSSVFKLVVYTAIGGGMGAAVNNIRSFVQWHAERKAFGWRFVWKYISMPPLGATLAVMVYAIIRGGIAVFSGGGFTASGTITSFSAWATGTLAGYGSHKVFIWLDDKVNTLFKVDATVVTVPDLSGKTLTEAEQILLESKLVLGEKSDKSTSDAQTIGKVVGQDPEAGAEVAPGCKVDITIGIASDSTTAKTAKGPIPDLIGKTQDEATKILHDIELELGAVSVVPTNDGQMIGKVTSQTPEAGTEDAPDGKVAIAVGIEAQP